jgi:hypothetical protein
MNIPTKFRLVTPEQLAEGYYESIDGSMYHRDFVPRQTRPDGNIIQHRIASLPLFDRPAPASRGDYLAAGDAFLMWDKDHQDGQLVVVPGLLRRRQIERAYYLNVPA